MVNIDKVAGDLKHGQYHEQVSTPMASEHFLRLGGLQVGSLTF